MNRQEQLSKIEKALIEAHRTRPIPEPDSDWQARVMSRVRRESVALSNRKEQSNTPLFVWRFAAVSCAFALVISLYAVTAGLGLEQLILLFVDDPLSAGFLSL